MADPSEYEYVGQAQTAEPVLDKNLPAYRYAKALCESARAAASPKTKTFKSKWDFFQGRDQWKAPQTMAAKQLDEWAYRGVVNWTYATVKTKAAMVTNAQSDTFVEPLDEESTYRDRQLWKAAIDREAERLHFRSVSRDIFLRGAVCYVGVGMVTAKPDNLTGKMAIQLKAIDPADFYCDPSADSLEDPACRFVVWEPELDMSTIREMWPSKADQVRADQKKPIYEKSGITYSKPDDSNLIYGSGGDFIIDPKGILISRRARVQFVWIVDESLVEDIAVAQGEQNAADGSVPDMEIRRKYPYGRLIVYSGETLLYDGENPYEIESVFPFFVYHHDRIPGDFYGQCDTDLVASLQEAQNTVLSMGVDGVVLSMFGPFEYPVGCVSYTKLGNGPKHRHPVPDHLAGKARFVPPTGADTNLWNGVLQNIEHQFLVVTGLTGPAIGMTSSPPISATEAEISNSRLSDRMKAHVSEFERALSRGLNLIRELMVQFYDEPIAIAPQMPNSEVQTTYIEVQQLPPVRIRCSISTSESLKDKLLGQNLAQGIQTGVLASPYAELFLESIGTPASRIKEVMERQNLQNELVPPGAGGPPPPPLSLVGGPNGQLQSE